MKPSAHDARDANPTHHQGRPKPWLWGTAAAGLVATTVGLALATQSSTQVPANTTVAGVAIGGLTTEAAAEALKAANVRGQQVTVRAGERSWTVQAAQLGWQVDVEATVAQAAEPAGNGFQRLLDAFGNPEPRDIPVTVKVDTAKAKALLDTLTADMNRAPRNASVAFDKTRYVVRPDEPGQRPDTAAAASIFAHAPDLTELTVPIGVTPAALTADTLRPHVEHGNRLMRPITIRAKGSADTVTLTPVQVANLYWVRTHGIEIDHVTVKAAVDRAARVVTRPARPARFVAKSGRLVPVRGEAGLTVIREDAITALTEAVTRADLREVTLPTRVDKPTVGIEDLPDPATLQLVSVGKSTYKGSSAERSANVVIAAQKLNGVVVPAGEEFSFLNSIGRITADNGFKSALVIANGRTVEGIGGGVCQVSTTVFRALYSAGLPVVERHQHAYRVRWYEPQVGFEAAVYDPGVDLRMKNDTGAHLLIRIINDARQGTLEVRVYGAPMKRKVEVSPAVVLSRTPAPPAHVVVNSALRPGARRQVDWAADGFNLYITRTITDDKGSRTERLNTNYRAWRAVYEVGPTN